MGKKLIKDFIIKRKFSYAVGILFMLMTSYIQSLFPKILGDTIDILKQYDFNPVLVKYNIAYILLIALGTFICMYAWRKFIIGNARNLECYLREKLYDHFQKLTPQFYSFKKTGDLMAYAVNDISAVRMTFGPATAKSINGIVICIISIYSMSRAINWRLTLLSIIPIPFIVFFMIKIGFIIQKRFRKVQESFAAISDRVQENITGIRVIKSYVQEDLEIKNFDKLNEDMRQANLSMVRISSFLSPAIELAFSISFVLNLIIGGKMVLAGSISLGDFTAFNGYLAMIMAPVVSIGRVINIFQRGMASLKRLDDIFNIVPDVEDGKKMVSAAIEGNIEIRNLSFRYPGTKNEVLEGINIKVPKGHTLGIIGKTGSGKSTIANLLFKLYNVESGKIFIDGIDINDYSLKSLREGFGYVPQDNFLFSAPIKDNIKFFKDIYSDEDVEDAAMASCIHDSISSFPEGYNTILGERGVNLSGGQKQRVSIARAVVKKPAILILDDALSAVDTVTESMILENFRKVRKDRTTIIIAHRISAVKDADEIIVMDKGRIIERGTHDELLRKGGLYYGIYLEQFKDREKEPCCSAS